MEQGAQPDLSLLETALDPVLTEVIDQWRSCIDIGLRHEEASLPHAVFSPRRGPRDWQHLSPVAGVRDRHNHPR